MSEVLELASLCDVVIENFRPGVMTRLGLGYEQVRALNAKVVYVSLPAYSRHDPRAKLRAYDSTISASCGLFTDLALAGSALNLPPTYTALPILSVYAGLWGAIAAVSSIYGLLQGGAGDHSLHETFVTYLCCWVR
jgi:crotonobetainyl-CoA:carnitine CoA-transferase CaiB-like acyl-CoA transferase